MTHVLRAACPEAGCPLPRSGSMPWADVLWPDLLADTAGVLCCGAWSSDAYGTASKFAGSTHVGETHGVALSQGST